MSSVVAVYYHYHQIVAIENLFLEWLYLRKVGVHLTYLQIVGVWLETV